MGDRLRMGKPPRRVTRHPGLLSLSLPRLEWVPGVSWGSKQAYRVTHQPVSVVSQCSLNDWLGLACGNQRLLTGSGSAEALRDDALYKSTYFTSLNFTGVEASTWTMQHFKEIYDTNVLNAQKYLCFPIACEKIIIDSTSNLAIANISRVRCAHNTLMASIVTSWPWNLG